MKLVALLLVLPTAALAEEYGELISGSTGAESIIYRSVPKLGLIAEGHDLGGEMRFITTEDLKFTDVALLTLKGRAGLGEHVDVQLQLDLLPKQPATTDDPVAQSAGLVVNVQPKLKLPVVLHAGGTGGVLLGDTGYWQQLVVGAMGRKKLHDIVRVEGSVNGLATRIGPHGAEGTWLVETGVAGSLLFRDPEGWTGGWVGVRYSLPVSHTGAMDPQPRMDFELGTVLSFIKHWDLYLKIAVIDRGDADVMASQLPILDGGFDQQQVIIGVNYHTR